MEIIDYAIAAYWIVGIIVASIFNKMAKSRGNTLSVGALIMLSAFWWALLIVRKTDELQDKQQLKINYKSAIKDGDTKKAVKLAEKIYK